MSKDHDEPRLLDPYGGPPGVPLDELDPEVAEAQDEVTNELAEIFAKNSVPLSDKAKAIKARGALPW